MKATKTDILKQPIPTLLATFAALLGLLTLRAMRAPMAIEQPQSGLSPVALWFDGMLGEVGGAVVVVVSIVLAAVLVTRITSRYSLSVIRSFVPMVLFVVCVYAVVLPIDHPSIVLAMLMVVHSVELMIVSFKRTERFSEVMRAAFWLGMAVLMVPKMFYLILLLLLQWLIWQRSQREMAAGVIMLLLPLIPASFAWWVDGKEPLWLLGEWWEALVAPSMSGGVVPDVGSLGGILSVVLFALVVLLTVASIVVFIAGYGSMRIRARKAHVFFATLFVVSLVVMFGGISSAYTLPMVGFASVPLVHTFFVRRKGLFAAVVYLLLVLLTALLALARLLN